MKCVIQGGNPEFRIRGGCTASTNAEAARCCANAASKVKPMEALVAYEDVKANPPMFESVIIGLLSAIHLLEERTGIKILD